MEMGKARRKERRKETIVCWGERGERGEKRSGVTE
jgi:hypothetical protein